MDLDFLFQFGYFGLFVISFLASSILPLASEFFVVAMPQLGYSVWWVGIVATLGSFVGSLTNYYIGLKGTDLALGRWFKIDPKSWRRASSFYHRWGAIALFFSWVPFIGDPLTAVAGAFELKLTTFSFWVLLGKGLRYVVLLGIADRVAQWFV